MFQRIGGPVGGHAAVERRTGLETEQIAAAAVRIVAGEGGGGDGPSVHVDGVFVGASADLVVTFEDPDGPAGRREEGGAGQSAYSGSDHYYVGGIIFFRGGGGKEGSEGGTTKTDGGAAVEGVISGAPEGGARRGGAEGGAFSK